MKRKCQRCKKKTENWQSVDGSPYHCFDGCYSTTSIDYRTINGKPDGPLKRELIFGNLSPR